MSPEVQIHEITRLTVHTRDASDLALKKDILITNFGFKLDPEAYKEDSMLEGFIPAPFDLSLLPKMRELLNFGGLNIIWTEGYKVPVGLNREKTVVYNSCWITLFGK